MLHSIDYKEKFKADLKKTLPKIPIVRDYYDFVEFSKSGRKLAYLHLNYEIIEPYEGLSFVTYKNEYKVNKMKFDKKDKSTIIYNDYNFIRNIPLKAYEYIINGKSAIEWIMERYKITIDKKSGIVNDPNDWCKQLDNPKYILNLLLSIINVSIQTVDIINSLPHLNFD